jgi:hypothetical protein
MVFKKDKNTATGSSSFFFIIIIVNRSIMIKWLFKYVL